MEKTITTTTFLAVILFLLGACEDKDFGEQGNGDNPWTRNHGLFIINEGNFGSGNGSITFYHPVTGTIEQNIFYSSNQRPLGDIPMDICFLDDRAVITVNNSGKAEVVSLDDFRSLETLSGLESPRNIQAISDSLLFISDLETSKMHVLRPGDPAVLSKMEVNKSTEALAYDGHYLYASNWSSFYVPQPNNTIMVIDPFQQTLVKTVEVAKEPNSIAIDKNGDIWVLSSGGYLNEQYPALTRIHGVWLTVEQQMRFPDKAMAPFSLTTNASGDSLLFINHHIYAMAVTDTALPQNPLIKAGKRNINSLVTHPQTGMLYFSNALDYQQKGWIIRCQGNPCVPTDSFRAGIVPARMRFFSPS